MPTHGVPGELDRPVPIKPAVETAASDCCPLDEAAQVLGMSSSRVNWLLVNGLLQRCVVEMRDKGVTRQSLADEVEWRRAASVWTRTKRALGYAFWWMP